MTSNTPSVLQLQRALAIAEQIDQLERELSSILGGGQASTSPQPAQQTLPVSSDGKRTRSAATKAKMAAAQQARWAAKRAAVSGRPTVATAPKGTRKKRVLSPEGRARIVAALKARHAAKRKAQS